MSSDNLNLSLVLADGTEISDLALNGNTYISFKQDLSKSVFDYNLSSVLIVQKNNNGELVNEQEEKNLKLARFEKYADGHIEFVLIPMTEFELYQLKVSGDIEYIAMMSGIDL